MQDSNFEGAVAQVHFHPLPSHHETIGCWRIHTPWPGMIFAYKGDTTIFEVESGAHDCKWSEREKFGHPILSLSVGNTQMNISTMLQLQT